MELTGNRMKAQLIISEEIKEEFQKVKIEVKQTMYWIHAGVIHIMIKDTFKEGIDPPIDIFICDKRICNLQDSILRRISRNLLQEKLYE